MKVQLWAFPMAMAVVVATAALGQDDPLYWLNIGRHSRALDLARDLRPEDLVAQQANIAAEFEDPWRVKSAELRALIIQRFEATKAVCDGLDAADMTEQEVYTRALFYVLGVVKDPGAIQWLDTRLKAADRRRYSDVWLDGWLHPYGGRYGLAPQRVARWVTGHRQWSEYLARRADEESVPERRIRLLRAMMRNLPTSETLKYLSAIENRPGLSDEERLAVQGYLYRRGKSIDAGILKQTIDRLKGTVDGKRTLLRASGELPHELFVPWLISIVADDATFGNLSVTISSDGMWYSQGLGRLREITLELSIEGRPAWEKWYEQHRNETHRQWVERAWREFVAAVETDPERLDSAPFEFRKAFLEDAPRAVAQVEVWATHKVRHKHLVRWIWDLWSAETATELRPVAERIWRDSGAELPHTARWQLEVLGVVEGEDSTWEAFVRDFCIGPY